MTEQAHDVHAPPGRRRAARPAQGLGQEDPPLASTRASAPRSRTPEGASRLTKRMTSSALRDEKELGGPRRGSAGEGRPTPRRRARRRRARDRAEVAEGRCDDGRLGPQLPGLRAQGVGRRRRPDVLLVVVVRLLSVPARAVFSPPAATPVNILCTTHFYHSLARARRYPARTWYSSRCPACSPSLSSPPTSPEPTLGAMACRAYERRTSAQTRPRVNESHSLERGL